MSVTIEQIPADEIRVGKRMRQVVETRVDKLVESIKALGLQLPVSVTRGGDGVMLVAGRHRLEACRKLGMERVPCFVMAVDDFDARLWEVDENLMRSELSPIERAIHLKRRKELWEQKHAAADGEGGSVTTEEFAEETAEITGEPKSKIKREIQRAAAVEEAGFFAEHLAGTVLDKGCELDALKKMELEQRRALIQRAVAGQPVSARPPRPEPSPEQEIGRLVHAFERLAERLEEEQRINLVREVLNAMPEEERREVLRGYA